MAANKGGKPLTKSQQELADAVCENIAGGMSVREACRQDGSPDRITFYRWLAKDENLRNQYARACEIRADAVFDEMFEISDDGTNDWVEREGSEEGQELYQINGEHVQRSRLRIDTRKWALARMSPRKYGDKVTLAGDEEAPLVTKVIIGGDA